MIKIKRFITKYYLELCTVGVLLLLLPLSLKVNFIQNDDWNRTLTTQEFIKGNFTLRPETANTFYLQGIVGMIFYYITGSTRFPILTLVFSVLNFYIFGLIVKRHFTNTQLSVVLLTLLFFLNPFHIYSIWGFMAENFYLFFTLFSFLFFFEQEKSRKIKYLIISNISIVLGFFVKQVSIVTALSYIVFYAVSRRWKLLIIQSFITLMVILYYYFLFPRTQEMNIKDITLDKLQNYKFIFSITWANLVYTTALTLPLFVIALYKNLASKKILWVIMAVIVSSLLVNKFFNPNIIGVGEFPYIQNTFTRFGFYSMNIYGTPYQYRFVYDIFTNWQLVSLLLAYTFSGIILINLKKSNSPQLYFYFGYLVLMILIVEMFDRYLLPLFPIFLLLLLKIIKEYKATYNVLVLPFVCFLVFINYQYSMDFVLSNNIMFNKAYEINKKENISLSQISVNRAWRKVYYGESKIYYFTYDSPEIGDLESKGYKMAEKLRIDYPLNIHINPYVYIYKNSQNIK